ncbi:MAG TPA: SPOR domain-containing protein [Pyrinomonadaceae bacterium]|nr:SPOR domain-containing protein [Pyrinomonadaceae bacterium]
MSYDFSFNKKTFPLLLGGCAFVGILLFIAGLLIGANWKAEPTAATTTAAVAGGPQVATPAPLPPPAPNQATAPPALKAEAVIPKPPNPSEVAVPNVAPAPVRQAHKSVEGINNRRGSAAPTIPEDDGGLKIIQEAEPPAAAESNARPSFSVQVGVFTKENDANQLVRQLQNKGYTPFVLTANDDGSRVLYAVRIGAYMNWDEAMQAASDFTKQEKIQTMVRPLGSL